MTTASASSPAVTVAPVLLLAPVNATVKSSSPSTKTSSMAATEKTIGAKLSPSAAAVNVNRPLVSSNVTPVVAEAAASKAARKSA